MTPKLFDEVGRLQLSEFERLSTRQLGVWLRGRLSGEVAPMHESREHADRPHYLINALLPHVDRRLRSDIQFHYLVFLAELADYRQNSWLNAAGEELLLSTPAVLESSVYREQGVGALLCVADAPRRYILSHQLNLHYRALQALVELRYRASTDFWLGQWRVGGNDYATVVSEGLSFVELGAVFRWLRQVEWTSKVETALLGILPSLLEDYGTGRVVKLTAAFSEGLPAPARLVLADFFEDSDVPFASDVVIAEALGVEGRPPYKETLVNRLYTIQPERRAVRPARPAGL